MSFLLIHPIPFSYPQYSNLYHHNIQYIYPFYSSSLGYDFVYQRTKDKKKAILGGIAFSTLAGLAKELADSEMYEQKFDKRDLMATSIGGITVSLTIPLFNKKK